MHRRRPATRRCSRSVAGLASTDLERRKLRSRHCRRGNIISPAFNELAFGARRSRHRCPTVDRHRRSSTVDDRLAYLVDNEGLVNPPAPEQATATDTTATLVVSPMLAPMEPTADRRWQPDTAASP